MASGICVGTPIPSQTKIGLTPCATAGANPLFTEHQLESRRQRRRRERRLEYPRVCRRAQPGYQGFKYFTFTGSVTDGANTYAIGTDDGGLFATNNDLWRYTIKDAQGNVIQGPYGE